MWNRLQQPMGTHHPCPSSSGEDKMEIKFRPGACNDPDPFASCRRSWAAGRCTHLKFWHVRKLAGRQVGSTRQGTFFVSGKPGQLTECRKDDAE